MNSNLSSAHTIYCTVGNYTSVKEQVSVSRNVSLAAKMRKSPNCFQLKRQVEILQRCGFGSAQQQFREPCFRFCLYLLSLSLAANYDFIMLLFS